MTYYPPSDHKHVLLVGNTGAGKSSLVNMITGEDNATVGIGPNPETKINKPCNVPGTEFYIWDTPGLGESPVSDEKHIKKIKELLKSETIQGSPRISAVALVVEFNRRDIGTIISILEKIVVQSGFAGRLLLIFNQIDVSKNHEPVFDSLGRLDPQSLTRFESDALTLKERIESSVLLKICDVIFTSARFNFASKSILEFFRSER